MGFWKHTDDGRRLIGPIGPELADALVRGGNRDELTIIGYITALVERDEMENN